MKKLKVVSVFFSLLMFISLTFAPNSQAAAIAVGDLNCKVEIIDCPGWFTGDRQVCHQNGTGVNCECGTSTKCGDDKEAVDAGQVALR